MERKIYEELYQQNEQLRKQNRLLDKQVDETERQTDLLKEQNRLLTNQLTEQTAILASIAGSLNNIPALLSALAEQHKN